MPASEIVLVAVCVACLSAAGTAVVWLRPRFGKDRRAALTFVLPGALIAAMGAWVAVRGQPLIVAPLATIAILCFAAGAIFLPTAATRFAAFERQFWAYVARHG